MGRKSSFRFIPEEIVAEIDRLLSENRATLDEILEHLRGLGVDSISRSALGRRKQKIEQVAKRLRQSREMMESLVRQVGPSVAEGEHGRLLVETLRGMVFDHLSHQAQQAELADDGASPIDNQGFFFLAKALKELSQANRLNQDFEDKIRAKVEKEAQAKMEKAVADVVGSADSGRMTPEELQRAIRRAYGLEA